MLAWEQFEIENPGDRSTSEKKGGELSMDYREKQILIRGSDFSINFSRESGEMTGWTSRGESLLDRGPETNVWRAATSNDMGTKFNGDPRFTWHWVQWTRHGLDRLQKSKLKLKVVKENSSQIVLEVRSRLSAEKTKIKVKTVYTISPEGEVTVNQYVKANKRLNWPKIGMMLELPGSYERVRWFGKGPHENYDDRSSGAAFGIYQSSINELSVPYVKPMENGNRSSVEWLEISKGNGRGIRVEGENLNFSAHRYTLQNLVEAKYDIDLKDSGSVWLNIDYKQNALGSESFMFNYLKKYILKGRKFNYTYTMKPGEDPAS